MTSKHGGRIPMEVDAMIEEAPTSLRAERQRSSSSLPVLPSSRINNISAAPQTSIAGTNANTKSMPVSFPAMADFQSNMTMLEKGWEDFNSNGIQFDPFKRFFGNEIHSIESSSEELKDMILDDNDGRFHTPLALRHTHSTPLQKAPSILDEYAMRAGLPPPIPLDLFQRSSSTPSAFRTRSVNSAFGSVRSASPANTEETCSLVGVQYVSEPAVSYRCSAFDPVQYYARQLEDMAVLEDMERTSIEVSAETMPSSSTEMNTSKTTSTRRPKRGAAVAERFLSNVRGFRRRRGRGRSHRDSSTISSSQSVMSTDGEEDDEDQTIVSVPPQTTVTVITEAGSSTTCSRNSEISAILKQSSSLSSCTRNQSGLSRRPSDQEEPLRPLAPKYHQLDSDVEEEVQYQKIEASLHADSPPPAYQRMMDERPPQGMQCDQIQIQVSGKRTPPTTSFRNKENASPIFNTPNPTRVSRSLESTLTQRSNDSMTDSPQTARSSNTGSSLGHTTQATSCSSIQQSNLSTISETDREVMLANKEGKRRRGLERLTMPKHGNTNGGGESVNSSSTNSNSTSTNPHGYLALQGSPTPREGANVAMDRFFLNGGSNSHQLGNNRVYSLGNSSSSRRSGRSSSPVSGSSLAMTHTSSSSSSRSEPPTFVSYLDRKNASDLTSTREELETSVSRSGGVDSEEREGSPADFVVNYQAMYFEEAAEQQIIKPVRPPSRPDKFRSRPPRSPLKGSRMITTPPPCRTSPLYQQLSPPRHIVDHPDQDISQPYVLRTTHSGKNFVLAGESGPCDLHDYGTPEVMHGITYEENSIEIMKSNSKDDLLPGYYVTPDN